ncbi:hypothetical protein MJO28_012480 [Puccinia striiformis f. sp. tritici]|uniref:Uncharacterized protein n=1 Tax=Puccinia striiformis f. sp. tritici TaxID=168172 RepID=A0ACC0E311_9BASI|nr:hypothetical protein MJO28_017858 [Puccinia striiformis f. sp. tritici]KAI7942453.1 hypothetical protein MJO28_012480 [Puccinia striiformis f. sp. tritici]
MVPNSPTWPQTHITYGYLPKTDHIQQNHTSLLIFSSSVHRKSFPSTYLTIDHNQPRILFDFLDRSPLTCSLTPPQFKIRP